MTIETAKAILNPGRREMQRPVQSDHTQIDRMAFEARMARLRPHSFLRCVPRFA